MRRFSSIGTRFPHFFWRFTLPTKLRRVPIPYKFERELYSEFRPGFQSAYNQLLLSFVNTDLEILRTSLEPELYTKVVEGLKWVKNQGRRLEIGNPDAVVSLTLYNAKVHVNIKLDRGKNKDPLYEALIELSSSSSEEDLRKDQEESIEPRIRTRDLILYESATKSNPVSAVLAVDCVYHSCAKLLMSDQSGNLVRGKKDNSVEQHVFRFETEFLVKDSSQISDYFLLGTGECPIYEFQWVVTDVDTCLNGNPFASNIKNIIMSDSDAD